MLLFVFIYIPAIIVRRVRIEKLVSREVLQYFFWITYLHVYVF